MDHFENSSVKTVWLLTTRQQEAGVCCVKCVYTLLLHSVRRFIRPVVTPRSHIGG